MSERLSRAVADSVLLIAGGAFATAYFEFTTTYEFLPSVIFAIILGAILIGISWYFRRITPPERVRLTEGEIDRIVSKLKRGEEDE